MVTKLRREPVVCGRTGSGLPALRLPALLTSHWSPAWVINQSQAAEFVHPNLQSKGGL